MSKVMFYLTSPISFFIDLVGLYDAEYDAIVTDLIDNDRIKQNRNSSSGFIDHYIDGRLFQPRYREMSCYNEHVLREMIYKAHRIEEAKEFVDHKDYVRKMWND